MTPPLAEVRDPEAARVILDLRQRRLLKPFLGLERTVGEAARELGVKPNSLLYQVRRLVGLGLLRRTRSEARAGRPRHFYRATADGFYVPFSLYDAATLEELLMAFDLPWLQFFNRNLAKAMRDAPQGPEGFLLQRQPDGRARVAFARPDGPVAPQAPPGGPSFLSDWLVLRLTPAEAEALRREQLELFRRYAGRARGRPHAVLLGITPVVLDTEVVFLPEER